MGSCSPRVTFPLHLRLPQRELSRAEPSTAPSPPGAQAQPWPLFGPLFAGPSQGSCRGCSQQCCHLLHPHNHPSPGARLWERSWKRLPGQLMAEGTGVGFPTPREGSECWVRLSRSTRALQGQKQLRAAFPGGSSSAVLSTCGRVSLCLGALPGSLSVTGLLPGPVPAARAHTRLFLLPLFFSGRHVPFGSSFRHPDVSPFSFLWNFFEFLPLSRFGFGGSGGAPGLWWLCWGTGGQEGRSRRSVPSRVGLAVLGSRKFPGFPGAP